MDHAGLTHRLAAFALDCCHADHPANRLERAKLHVLDTLGAMVSGTRLPAGRFARTLRGDGAGPATVVCAPGKAPAATAALLNALCAHADETDDAHQLSTTHPGAAVIPAALAVAEQQGASGRDLIGAVIVGYELCARIGQALGSSGFVVEKGFDTHAIGGTFGAAAAAGYLTLDSEDAFVALLALAAHEASGLATIFRDPHHVEKAYVFAGKPAREGVEIAQLALRGLRGVDDALEGVPGFLSVYGADHYRGFADLGQSWAIESTNIKRWCVGSPAQAALDALEHLMVYEGVTADRVAGLQVYLPQHGAKVVDNRDMPSISVQHLLAVMLCRGPLSFADSHDHELMRDPEILTVRERVQLKVSEQLTQEEPRRQAIVSVRTVDGAQLSHRVRAVRGTVENPMTEAEVVAKVTDLCRPVLGPDRTEALVEAALRLDELGTVDELTRPLAPE